MKVLPFRKLNSAASASQRRAPSERIVSQTDDFDREIELTRENETLIALLKERSDERATITLQEVKRRMELD
jgi:hypothetical protein